jgi:hypothetical protein
MRARAMLEDLVPEIGDQLVEERREGRQGGRGEKRKRPRQPIKLVPFDKMVPDLSETDLVAGLLGSGQLGVLYGQPGCGKTFLALDIALHVAVGEEWLGRRVTPGCVVYLAAEAGRGIDKRVYAWRARHHYMRGAEDVRFYAIQTQLDLCTEDEDLHDLITAIRRKCGRDEPVLIVVDTVSRVMGGGDENSSADMGALIAAADALRDEFGSHVMLVHHLGKDASRGARGHSSLNAAVDTAVEVSRNEDAKLSTAKVVKQRDGEVGGKIHFRLDVVKVGVSEVTGEDVTSCVVIPADADQVAAAGRETASRDTKPVRLALGALQQAITDEGKRPPFGVQCPAEKCVAEDAWREAAYRAGISDGGPRARRLAFQRAAETLIGDGRVGSQKGYAWEEEQSGTKRN